jgi:hypothetical protein
MSRTLFASLAGRDSGTATPSLRLKQELRQLRDIGCDLPRLVLC